jgi:hypothetical protein
MKKFLAILAASAGLLVASGASAQTTVVTNWGWNGGGQASVDAVASGSTHSNVVTNANSALGTVTFTNMQNNPYGYGVDSTTTDVDASVGNGGWIQSTFNRTGSGAPYGAAGQSIQSYAFSNDGTAAVSNHAVVNYASLSDVGYGNALPSGNSVEAAGSSFQVNYAVNTGVANNSAGITATGSGSAAISQNFSGVSATNYSLAQGGGIFTKANFSAQGIGTMQYGGVATKQLTLSNTGTQIYGTAANPASFTGTLTYDTTGAGVTQTYIDFSVSGQGQ